MTALTERVFNTADVRLSAKEAQRRRAALSQSPAMQSTLPATVSFVQPALFLPAASLSIQKVNYLDYITSLVIKYTFRSNEKLC